MTSTRFREINERMQEIRSLLNSDKHVSTEELNILEVEIRELNEEKSKIEQTYRTAREIGEGKHELRVIQKPGEGSVKMNDFDNMKIQDVLATEEYRSAFFKTLQGIDLSADEQRAYKTVVEKRAFSTDALSAGPAIPTSTHNEVIRKLKQSQALFPYIHSMQMPGNIKIPVEVGEAGASWVDELDDIPLTGNGLTSVDLGGHTLAKLIPVSIAAEKMSVSAFESYLVEVIVEKMSIAVETAILNGSGTGQPTGILTGVTWTPGTNSFDYSVEEIYQDLLKPLQNLESGYLPGAAWCMSSQTLYGDIVSLQSDDGEPIFLLTPTEEFVGRIMGKPVILNDYMPADTILFGNFKYYFMNFSEPILFEKSRESGFRKATVDYRGVAVLDGKPALDEAFIKLEKAS